MLTGEWDYYFFKWIVLSKGAAILRVHDVKLNA
jgi:hypothetical protein